MQDVSQHLRSSFFILEASRGRFSLETCAGALGWKPCLGGLETPRGRLALRKPLLSVAMNGIKRRLRLSPRPSAHLSKKKSRHLDFLLKESKMDRRMTEGGRRNEKRV